MFWGNMAWHGLVRLALSWAYPLDPQLELELEPGLVRFGVTPGPPIGARIGTRPGPVWGTPWTPNWSLNWNPVWSGLGVRV